MEIVFCSNFLAIVSLQYAHICRHISTSTLSFCTNIISQKFLWLKSISEMDPAFSQLHHVLHDDTTKACLLTVSLRRSVRSGPLQTSWARSVAHRKARSVRPMLHGRCDVNVNNPVSPLSRMPQIKCATPWAVSNSDEFSTTRQIVVVEHWLFTSQSLWRHDCVFP